MGVGSSPSHGPQGNKWGNRRDTMGTCGGGVPRRERTEAVRGTIFFERLERRYGRVVTTKSCFISNPPRERDRTWNQCLRAKTQRFIYPYRCVVFILHAASLPSDSVDTVAFCALCRSFLCRTHYYSSCSYSEILSRILVKSLEGPGQGGPSLPSRPTTPPPTL